MESIQLPEDCAKQWELILLLLSSEEKKFDKTNENEIDMVTYFYKNEGVRKILQQWLWQMNATAKEPKSDTDTPLKSNEVALLWRQRGNEKFRVNDMLESYRYYTKSVLYATRDSEMFALALANRSATLLRLKRYKECLMDICLALSSGYPSNLSHKLHLREADSYIELHQIAQAKASLSLAIHEAQSLQLSPGDRMGKNHDIFPLKARKIDWRIIWTGISPAVEAYTLTDTLKMFAVDLDRNIKLLEKKLQLAGAVRTDDATYSEPVCYLGENKDFVNASTALELRQSESFGRHVVTTTEVQRGNILFVEEPYAFVALPIDGLMPIVCENCCESNINSVPCCTCSRSIYCSDECRLAAWNSFHQWECVGAQSEVWPTIGIAHLALRVLLISTKNGFPATNVNISNPASALAIFKSYSKWDSVEVYKNCNQEAFLRVFHLVTNFDKMNNTDYIQYALTAVMLTLYLEVHTNYFEYLPTKLPCKMSEPEMRTLVSSLLLRHLGQLVCNGHAIMALNEVNDGQRTSTEREIRLATAIYPSASMMNHSCDPNIINSFERGRLVVKAARDMACADEVYNCYGPAYTREPAQHRRAQLRAQYLFLCACPACTHPDKRDFVFLFTAYSCHLCKGPVIINNKKTYCKQCKSTDLKLDKTLAVLNQSEDLIKQSEFCGSVEERCEKLLASLKLKQQVLHRHHTAVRDTMDRLACLYSELGEWGKSVEMIKQCVPSLEYQFGSFSVEVAHELRKLADVMLERVFSQPHHPHFRDWCLETHKITKKALQLLELNYGPWDESYKRLLEKEEVVRSLLAQSQHSRSDHSIHDLLHYNLKI